jgi:hypothetical protein
MIKGRFNFLTIRSDSYNVIWVPKEGDLITVIATSLSRREALNLINHLNQVLGVDKEEFRKRGEEENA